MTRLLMFATVCSPLGSDASEKAEDGDQNLRFRCEVILPQRVLDIPTMSSNPTKIELGLRITNTGTDDLLVGRYMALHIVFRDSTGRELESGGYANGMMRPRTADYRILSSGDSTTFKIDASLRLTQRGSMFLGGPDGYGAVWGFYPKDRGSYGIQVKYRFAPEAGFRIPGPERTSIPVNPQHIVPIEFTSEILTVAIKNKKHEGGAGQPATRPESKPEGSDKSQPETEGRSR